MITLNLDYQVHSLEDIFNDPDLDTMLEGLDDQQESKNNQLNKPRLNKDRAFTLLNFVKTPPVKNRWLVAHEPNGSEVVTH